MGTDIILPPTGFLANSWKHNLFRLKTILPTLNDDSAAHWPAWNKKNKIKIKKANRVGDLCWRSWSGPSLSAYARRHVFAWLRPNLILFHSSICFLFFFVHEANIIFVHERIWVIVVFLYLDHAIQPTESKRDFIVDNTQEVTWVVSQNFLDQSSCYSTHHVVKCYQVFRKWN